MTFSGSSTQSSLNEIQRQLSSIKSIAESLRLYKNGVSCHWISANKWFRGQRFTQTAELLASGTQNQTKYTNNDVLGEWQGLLNGVCATASADVPVKLVIPIQGRFLYKQYWFYTATQVNPSRYLFVNNKNILNIPDIHSLSSPKIPFYTEHEIDSGNSQAIEIAWYGTATSFPEINAFQLLPLD